VDQILRSVNESSDIEALLSRISTSFQDLLDDNLIGIYIHGSLAMGCFNPASSDVDFLVVVRHPLDSNTKQKVAETILTLNKQAPAKGLEMSIVLLEHTQQFVYPTPFEFHFSNDWTERYNKHEVDFNEGRTDPDLAAHFTITKTRGYTLSGQPINEVFGDVPEKYYLESILEDGRAILEDMTSNSVYDVLNLCRIIAYLQDRVITSKQEGGEWAIKHLPTEYRAVVQQALDEYGGLSGQAWDTKTLQDFKRYTENRLP
jgi:predicted nucleotidyltransferase